MLVTCCVRQLCGIPSLHFFSIQTPWAQRANACALHGGADSTLCVSGTGGQVCSAAARLPEETDLVPGEPQRPCKTGSQGLELWEGRLREGRGQLFSVGILALVDLSLPSPPSPLLFSSLLPPPLPQISYVETLSEGRFRHLLAIPSKEKLLRVIKYLLDEDEFLSPYGIRSLSKVSQSV